MGSRVRFAATLILTAVALAGAAAARSRTTEGLADLVATSRFASFCDFVRSGHPVDEWISEHRDTALDLDDLIALTRQDPQYASERATSKGETQRRALRQVLQDNGPWGCDLGSADEMDLTLPTL